MGSFLLIPQRKGYFLMSQAPRKGLNFAYLLKPDESEHARKHVDEKEEKQKKRRARDKIPSPKEKRMNISGSLLFYPMCD